MECKKERKIECRIEFSPSLLSDKKKNDDEAKAKAKAKAKLKEILNAVCAILNCPEKGGELIVFSPTESYSPKDADDLTRRIEQKFKALFGLEKAREVINKIPETRVENNENVYEIRYEIKQPKLCTALYTVNYNLHCSTNTEVHTIPSSEPLDDVASVFMGEQTREKKNVFGQHSKEFVHDKVVRLEESKETQLKLVGDTNDECLANNMTNDSNKLTHYVSAFANGSGGHIYFGIKFKENLPHEENGFYVAYGQNVRNKDTIINEVESTISKMFVWRAGQRERLIKGEQWDIVFEKVSNVEEKYVIVISVNSHDRGVFAKDPESYVMDENGKVTRMEFEEWAQRLLSAASYGNIFSDEMVPETIGRCGWSSPEALENHVYVLKELVIRRNDGCVKEFDAYKDELLTSSNTEYPAQSLCLLQQQEAGNFFRKGLLDDALAKLKENEHHLTKIGKDKEIYWIRWLYWKGVVKRAQGCYDVCRELCEDALQRMDTQPVILVLPWAHYNRAKILEIDLAKAKNASEEQKLKAECMGYYESALRYSFALKDFPESLVVDLKQRVLIAMARLRMGACYDGEHVVRKTCSPCDIKHVDYLMDAVDYSVDDEGLSMTKLCEAEYLLVRAERCYYKWKKRSELRFINKALKKSSKALKIAKTRNFKDARVFAEAQIAYLKSLP